MAFVEFISAFPLRHNNKFYSLVPIYGILYELKFTHFNRKKENIQIKIGIILLIKVQN